MRRRRIRKPKPTIRMKVRPARRDGKCTGCGGKIYKGADAAYVTHRARRYHATTCVPANVLDEQTVVAGPPRLPTNPVEAGLAALAALENALIVKAKVFGVTDEMEVQFSRYQKLKALALNEGAFDNEAKIAFRRSLITAINLVF